MTTNTQIKASVTILAIVFAAIFFIAFGSPRHQQAHAGGQAVACVDLTRSGSGNVTTVGCSPTGTTTPVFLTAAAATTTMTVPTGNATAISLNMDAVASSSATVYTFSIRYSFNGVDWYGEDTASTTGAVTTHSGAYVTHTWTPGVTAETRRSLNLPTHGAKFTQIGFQAIGAAGSIYPQAILSNAIVN